MPLVYHRGAGPIVLLFEESSMERLCRVLVLGVFTVIALAAVEGPLRARSQGRPFYVSVMDSKGAPKAGITAS